MPDDVPANQQHIPLLDLYEYIIHIYLVFCMRDLRRGWIGTEGIHL